MKKILMALALMTATTAQASDADYVDQINSLPSISQAEIEIVPAPAFATVEPTTWIKFTFKSCARYDLTVSVEKIQNINLIAVETDPRQMDCHGPTVERDYRLQVASETSFGRYVILNPIATTTVVEEEEPIRMCTMIAGYLFNPDTQECVFFSNGCQRADLIAAGMVSPPAGHQCQ